ncbi:hypothetical protein NC652_014534 [Populus alba x Populus x berolinensis]|nr:hypothetical protein NC652_014534 [Populus alba x Populus x berolinensis]
MAAFLLTSSLRLLASSQLYLPSYLDPMYNIQDFATGVCFASAGSGYDNATADVLGVIPLWQELENYEDYQRRMKA